MKLIDGLKNYLHGLFKIFMKIISKIYNLLSTDEKKSRNFDGVNFNYVYI